MTPTLRKHPHILLAAAALAPLALPMTASAADAPAAKADQTAAEIVVTAQRRAEKVTQVPISITVADSAALERQQINTVGDLNRIAPSLEINTAPGQNTGGGGTIRGIGTQTFSAGAVPSVGIVVDQVSQGNANISDLFDIARVEVLKGPQGTLFGLTTSAGVINITTNKPVFNRLEARVRTELSSAGFAGSGYGNQVVQGLVNVPLASTAALRVSGFANLRQGPDYNLTTGKYDPTDSFGFRGHLLWQPSDALTVNVLGDYSQTHTREGGDFFTFIKTSGAGLLPLPTPFPVPDNVTGKLSSCGITAAVGNRNFCTSQLFSDQFKTGGASLELDYQAGALTITSITAYRHTSEVGSGAATNVFRADPLILQVQNGPVDVAVDLLTQELRLSSPSGQRVEYTVGLFGSSQIAHHAAETLNVNLDLAPHVVIPAVVAGTSEYHVSDRSAAVFGQATIHVGEGMRVIAGARYTQDDLRLTTYADAIPYSTNSSTDLSVGKLSWKIGGQLDVAPRTMAYATVSRGFKGGQISTPAGAAPYAVQPEIPTSWELGAKSTLFGGWVLDADVFYQVVANFQAQSCATNGQGTLSCIVSNISGVHSRGAEVSLFGKVSRQLSLNTGFIWAKASYPQGYLGSDGSNIGGTQLAYAPEFKFTFAGEYTQPLRAGIDGFVAFDTVWKSRVRYEATSVTDSTFAPHFTTGGRLGVRTADQRFTAALFARNLFNVHEPILEQSSFPYSGGANIGAMYGPNGFRQVGLSLDGKF